MIWHVVPAVPLAHAGEGATWQALLTTIAIGIGVVFLLAVVDRVKLAGMGELVLPLAAVAILSSLAPIAATTLSDWVGWAVPVGLVALLASVLAAENELRLRWRSALAISTIVLAVADSLLLGPDLNREWHPPVTTLPLSDDAALTIVEPEDEATVPGEEVVVRIELTGATAGPPREPGEEVPDDPEEFGRVRLFVDGMDAAVFPRRPARKRTPARASRTACATSSRGATRSSPSSSALTGSLSRRATSTG